MFQSALTEVAIPVDSAPAAVEPGEMPVFVVELEGAGVVSGRFGRAELWCVPGEPVVAEAPDAEPGAAADRGRMIAFRGSLSLSGPGC